MSVKAVRKEEVELRGIGFRICQTRRTAMNCSSPDCKKWTPALCFSVFSCRWPYRRMQLSKLDESRSTERSDVFW